MPLGLVSPIAESVWDKCMLSDRAVFILPAFLYLPVSLVTILGSAVGGCTGCTTLPRLPDHNPRVTNGLVGGCLHSALKVRKAHSSADVGHRWGTYLSTFKICCLPLHWREGGSLWYQPHPWNFRVLHLSISEGQIAGSRILSISCTFRTIQFHGCSQSNISVSDHPERE